MLAFSLKMNPTPEFWNQSVLPKPEFWHLKYQDHWKLWMHPTLGCARSQLHPMPESCHQPHPMPEF